MDSNSTITTNSYVLSPPYSFRSNTSLSSDSSSIFSMYSHKDYTNFYKLKAKTKKVPSTSKWFTTRLRPTTKKSEKTTQKTNKLAETKTKTNSKKRFSVKVTSNLTTPIADNTYDIETLFNIDKNLTNKYRSTILKIMDKPLEWFRIRSKKSNLRRKSTTNFKSFAVNKNALLISNTNKSQIVNLNFLMTAPSMSSSLNYELSNIENISSNNSYMIEQKFHSTPQSQYCKQFSPIMNKSLEINCSSPSTSLESRPSPFLLKSTPINCSSTQNNSILSVTPSISRRLSFGVTSSPKPLICNVTNIDASDQKIKDLNESFDGFSYTHNFYEHQQRLIDHINSIKQSVKLGVEMRNKKSFQFNNNDSFKQWAQGTKKNKDETECRIMSKRKKLQKIFQIKLKKQLKEMKNWQMSVKSEFETQSDLDTISNQQSTDCVASFGKPSHKFQNSTNNSIDSIFSYHDSPKNISIDRHTCQCKYFRTENKQIIIYQNNFNYVDCVNNYF